MGDRHPGYGKSLVWKLEGFSKRTEELVSEVEFGREQMERIRPLFDADLSDGCHPVTAAMWPHLREVLDCGPMDPEQDYFTGCYDREHGKHPLVLAREFVGQQFPDALTAFLGGSAAAGNFTATSDLDVVVVLDGPPAPFRETTEHRGWVVEVFCHTEESFWRFVETDLRGRRSPLLSMVGHGVCLTDMHLVGERLQEQSRLRHDAGPPPLTPTQLDDIRYGITDLLDDLAGATDEGERLFIATRLLTRTAELALDLDEAWRGTGKWLLRKLRESDADLADELVGSFRADLERFAAVCERVLGRAGGRLMAGYRRAAP